MFHRCLRFIITCLTLSHVLAEPMAIHMRIGSVLSMGHRLIHNTCCEGFPDKSNTCSLLCEPQMNICFLPHCQSKVILLPSSTDDEEKNAFLKWQGEHKLLIDIWHIPREDKASGHRLLMAKIPLDLASVKEYNWTSYDVTNFDIHVTLDFRLIRCEQHLELPLCSELHRQQLKQREKIRLQQQRKQEQLQQQQRQQMFNQHQQQLFDSQRRQQSLQNNWTNKMGIFSSRGFIDWFTSFLQKLSGFSSRISNIVNLLDVFKRILSYMF